MIEPDSTGSGAEAADVGHTAYREDGAAETDEEGMMTSQTVDEMSAEQRAREQASMEVSNTLTNLDHALTRARKALAVVQKSGVDPNAEHALADLVEVLQTQRKQFVQQAYYSVSNKTRMF